MLDISFNPMGPSPMSMYVMQSEMDTDKVIRTFEQALQMGYNPGDAMIAAMQQNNVRESDLTAFDIDRLNRRIEAAYGADNNTDRRY
jgi:hypothetical protein